VRGYAAEALVLAGDLDGAQHELEKALQFADKHAERVYLPQLFLIEAAIARARGQPAAAHASVRRAIAEARAQEAPWLELITLLELCKTHGAKSDDRRTLAMLLERLPETAETTPAATAQALLDGTRIR
jgi:ATP/maltotriose-dependent transcriptional regulator MalT